MYTKKLAESLLQLFAVGTLGLSRDQKCSELSIERVMELKEIPHNYEQLNKLAYPCPSYIPNVKGFHIYRTKEVSELWYVTDYNGERVSFLIHSLEKDNSWIHNTYERAYYETYVLGSLHLRKFLSLDPKLRNKLLEFPTRHWHMFKEDVYLMLRSYQDYMSLKLTVRHLNKMKLKEQKKCQKIRNQV